LIFLEASLSAGFFVGQDRDITMDRFNRPSNASRSDKQPSSVKKQPHRLSVILDNRPRIRAANLSRNADLLADLKREPRHEPKRVGDRSWRVLLPKVL
jgi:hypothetical protein